MTHQTPAEQGEAAARKDAQRNLPEPWRPPDNLSAEKAYSVRYERIGTLLQELETAKNRHGVEFMTSKRKSWIYAEDLGYIEEFLAQAIHRLGGTTAADDEAWRV